MEKIIEFDEWLLLTVNGMNNQYIDPMMKTFSGRGIWIVLYVAIAATIWWKYGWRNALIMIAASGIAVGAADYVCASVIRPLVQRLRPSNLENEISALVHIVDGYRSGQYGFPSCHAANTVALATITSLWMKDKWYTLTICLWAAMQCYSRMYLGVHYPGDLAVGALIGCALAFGVYYAVKAWIRMDINANKKATAMPVVITCIAVTIFIIIKSLV